ncbi:MAG: ABC transporter ATP-binding protein [Clostridia bacterium]|nr:ABC transporter ATP-binding protein [Lachnospiraceae bacterium]NCC00207.1 ABC transporter ATP-binding protein [Clostridia bacterium]NCD03309.1 ABC transporter ATP-binding protein [Clostridia bacterium]
MKIIETKNLTKYYGKARGIIDLNLDVAQSEIFGFIGPNGAGKSTTIRTLLGLISPTSGNASIFGKDILKDKTEILSNIGYMPSEAMFYNNMRVHEVIRLSADLHKKDCRKNAAQLCKRFDLDTKKKVNELSLGNRKKVSIVCAFQHQPDLYILDEPTSGLDPLMQKAFFELIHERQQQGGTVFLSSHVLSEIQRHCQRAAIIREGRLIACDLVENLSNTKARQVVLHGVNTVPALSDLKNIETSTNSVSFLFQGNMKDLISEIDKLPITDMTITEPELEEIFMHFYEGEVTSK